jgi:acyl-CoA synthetase (AMP-forming)/AMP-acid ligase II
MNIAERHAARHAALQPAAAPRAPEAQAASANDDAEPMRHGRLDRADTIPALLAERRRTDPGVRMMVSDDEAITFARLDEVSRQLAGHLVAAGVNKGDRVGLLMPNGIDWAVKALAVVRIGAVLVPLSTLLRPPELRAQLGTVAVTHLVTARRFRDRDYLADLDEAGTPVSLRHVWPADELPSPPGVPAIGPTLDDQAQPVNGGHSTAVVGPAELPHRAIDDDGEPPTDSTFDEQAPSADRRRRTAELVAALEEQVRPSDDLVVLFTSGSRGAPKGVIHTHGNALRATRASLSARCVGPGERLYIPMPLFWTGGFCGGLLSVLVAGATLLTESDPEPGRTLRMLERERVTMFRGWPDQAARMGAHPDFATTDLSSLEAGSLAGVLPPDQRPAPGARANLFGMTESCGPYCGAPLDLDMPPAAHGSCGRPFDGIEVRIVAPAADRSAPGGTATGSEPVAGEADGARTRAPGGDRAADDRSDRPGSDGDPAPADGSTGPAGDRAGADAGTSAYGEIQLRGPNLMRGIHGRDRSTVFTPDGFYPTGDLGRVDADGYLWFSGRLDDMFKVRGATVYPSEVEAALRSITGVSQAFATDVDGEVAALVITALPLADLRAEARRRLSAFKVPRRWLLTTDGATVPLLATAKVDKPALQALLAAQGVSATPSC